MGLACAGIFAVCQAVGLIMSKLGMGHAVVGWEGAQALPEIDPWTATLVRMAFAAPGIIVLAMILRLGRRLPGRVDPAGESISGDVRGMGGAWCVWGADGGGVRVALLWVLMGVALGPVLGVWCSMVGVDETEAGVAATLMAMSPVLVLPLAVWLEKERVSWRAVLGAVIAVGGVVILAFSSSSQSS